MKRLLAITLVATSLFLISCKKDKDDSPKTKTELLTSKTWIYSEYFTSYNQTLPTLQYKKGRTNNSFDLTNAYLKFNADGTYTRKNNTGDPVSGTWAWIENETKVQTTEPGGTNSSTTVKLTNDIYIWNDISGGTYGEMIPQ